MGAKPDPLLNTEEVAEILGKDPKTLYNWRWRGDFGPRSFRVGRDVRYKAADVARWIEEQAALDRNAR